MGGADDKSTFVVGPAQGDAQPHPTTHILEGVHEVAGVGTLFPDDQGNPSLHMHMACGRNGKSRYRLHPTGVKVWEVMEVILFEMTDCEGKGSLTLRPDLTCLIPKVFFQTGFCSEKDRSF